MSEPNFQSRPINGQQNQNKRTKILFPAKKIIEKIKNACVILVLLITAFLSFCPILRNAVSFTVMNYEEVAEYSRVDKDVRISSMRDDIDFNAELDVDRQQKINNRRK